MSLINLFVAERDSIATGGSGNAPLAN